MKTNEIKKEINEIKILKEKVKRKDLKYETNKYVYDFQQFETIIFFDDSIYTGKIKVYETEMDQTNLYENVIKFNAKFGPKTKEGKDKKRNTFESVSTLYEGRELTFSKVEYFQ